MKVLLNTTQGLSRVSSKMAIPKNTVSEKFDEAVKEMLELFKQTNEIGRLEEPLIVRIERPFKDSKISEAKLKIESPKVKDDFRSRVLSMIAESEELNGGTSVVLANGNKFAIESTLKNPSTTQQFKDFIKEAEKDFNP